MQLQYPILISGLGILFTSIHVHYLQTGRYSLEEELEHDWDDDIGRDSATIQRTSHETTHDFDIFKEPLSPTVYTKCSVVQSGENNRFIFHPKPFSRNIPITDNRTLERIVFKDKNIQNTLSERTVRIGDEDFFQKVTKEVVTSHLFDMEDEREMSQDLDYFRLRPTIVNTFVPKFLIGHNYPMCGEAGGSGGRGGGEGEYPYLLVFVFSQISHFRVREVIRQTWGQPSSNWVKDPLVKDRTVKVMFIIGYEENVMTERLSRESALYHDVIQVNVLDTYANLTLKTVSALYWARNYCPGVAHVMKIDSDTFCNMPELVNVLQALPDRAGTREGQRWMLGALHRNPEVLRSGRWEVDPAVYPMEKFPISLFGHSYVISGCVIEDLLRGYHRMPLVPVEDVFFTGIVAKTMGIRRMISPWFADRQNVLLRDTIWQPFLNLAVTATHFDTWQRHLEYYVTFISTYIYYLKN